MDKQRIHERMGSRLLDQKTSGEREKDEAVCPSPKAQLWRQHQAADVSSWITMRNDCAEEKLPCIYHLSWPLLRHVQSPVTVYWTWSF